MVRAGWPLASATSAAEYAVTARYKGKGIPSAAERAALDIPLARWANAMGKGIGVRVPNSPQSTDYTCGPAALRGALSAFGIGAQEDDLAALAETSANGGTSIEDLAVAARQYGCECEIAYNMTVDQLASHLKNGVVVVTCVQAWKHEVDGDYSDYEASHWVVPCAVTDKSVLVMDPTLEASKGLIPIDEFEERWHGIDMGKEINGLGLVIWSDTASANSIGILEAISPMI